MVSVIVCARNESLWKRHEGNIARTVGCPYEYVRIDNRANKIGLCAAYNAGVAHAHGDVFVFVHEDVFFLEPGWGSRLEAKFAADPGLGLAGVAGGQFLSEREPGWSVAGKPYIHGKVVHEVGGRLLLSAYSWHEGDIEVAAVDGLFFAIRRSLFERVKFDEVTFNGFHFYDLDICMQVRATHRVVVTDDVLVKHLSEGSFDAVWCAYAGRFLEKYKDRLPVSITGDVPKLDKPPEFDTIDVTERFGALRGI